jgi:AcrR family transcriptional regulator
MSWLAQERTTLAAERILDAAGELFAERGISGVSMGEVAAAAGCSRATLYRYFADRRELHVAFVHREGRRVGALVAGDIATVQDGQARVVAAVMSSVRRVRANPHLAAWFEGGDAALTSELVGASDVLDSLGLGLTGDALAARWLVRVVVSLLSMPGHDEDEERELVARFVAPTLPGCVPEDAP